MCEICERIGTTHSLPNPMHRKQKKVMKNEAGRDKSCITRSRITDWALEKRSIYSRKKVDK